MRRIGLAVACSLVVGLGTAAGGRDSEPRDRSAEEKPTTKAGEKAEAATNATPERRDDGPPVVFTNAELERRYGDGAPASGVRGRVEADRPTAPEAAAGVATAGASPGNRPAPKSRAERAAELERTIASLEDRIAELRRRRLALRNPYLPRPTVQRDQRERWNAMSVNERIRSTDAALEQAEAELIAARSAAERLRRTAAGGS